VERRAPEGHASTELELARADVRVLPQLSPTRYERARQKGGPAPLIGFAGGGITALALPGFGVAPALRVGLRKELGEFGLRIQAEVARKDVHDQTLNYTFWSGSGAAALVMPLYDGRVFVEGGVVGGYVVASQVGATTSYTGSGPLAGGVLQATMLFGRVRLGLDLQAEARFFRLNDAATVRPAGSLSLVALFNP
jgi:hypothetical protein